MVRQIKKKGFTLIEVLITTIVMSMIMGSVLAFVQYAGGVWSRGQEKVSTKNYSRMAFELIKEELLTATEVAKPEIGNREKHLEYKYGNDNYKIHVDSENVLVKEKNENNKVRLSRNVKEFEVKRLSKTTFEISLKIQEEQEEEVYDDDGNLIEPEIVSNETMVLIAPGVM